MALCAYCDAYQEPASLLEKPLALPSYGQLERNAAQGCEGCRFFRDAILRIRLDGGAEAPSPESSVSIRAAWRQRWVNLSCWDPQSSPAPIEARILPGWFNAFEPTFLIPENPTEEACWQRAREWLRECTEHGCAPQVDTPLPKRVIELADDESAPPRLFLPPPGTTGRFVALTHCWGPAAAHMTKLLSANEAAWQSDGGIDVSSLSRNFVDALVVARRLGFRHVWIDALCIVQDSAADWVEQAPEMTTIYGTAALVLSAASAAHSDQGFLVPRAALTSPLLGASRERYFVADVHVVGEHEWRKVPPLSVVGGSVLSSRGWAAQERILATRILHYTTFEMIWECARCCRFESTRPQVEEGGPDARHGQGMVLNKADMLVPAAQWRRAHDHQTEPRKDEAGSEPDAILRVWFNCLQEFSPRRLTYSSDKLPAVAGLAAMFSISLRGAGGYLAGLWSGHVARCLAWQCQVNRRTTVYHRAPSWSWASVDGEVWYDWEGADHILHSSVASSPWPSRHNPRLVDHHMVLGSGSNPYMGVEEGSFIVLEGNCMDARTLKSLSFGTCCEVKPDGRGGYSGSYSGRPGFDNGPEEIVLMQLQWTTKEFDPARRVVICGLLLCGTGSEPTFRRIGLARFAIPSGPGNVDGQFKMDRSLEETYDSLRWRRRALKLI